MSYDRKLACAEILRDKVIMDNIQGFQRVPERWRASIVQPGDVAYPFLRCDLIREGIHSKGEGKLAIGFPDERVT